MIADNLSSKIRTVRQEEDSPEEIEVIEVEDIREFMREEAKLFDLMATENISMNDFWYKRNKLLGDYLQIKFNQISMIYASCVCPV